jgi:hypothetical protein
MMGRNHCSEQKVAENRGHGNRGHGNRGHGNRGHGVSALSILVSLPFTTLVL